MKPTIMKARFIFFIAMLLFGMISRAQEQAPEYITITGKVLDHNSKKPLAYAHVGIPEKGIGTTTGSDGGFTFKVPERYSNSTMVVTYIGYSNFKKSLKSLNQPATIYLKQTPSDLSEVVVMGEAAIENIIRKAVNNIPQNYPTHSTTVLGFYRESRTDDSLRYRYLAEGVLNIYKSSYKKKKEGMVSLVQGRKINLKNPLDTNVSSHFTSGHMAAHRFDFVKNRVDFIDERFFPAYKYWIERITYYNDRPVFIIGFDVDETAGNLGTVEDEFNSGNDNGGSIFSKLLGKASKKKNRKAIKGRMKGRIFIEQESYAFVRAEFEITPEGLRKHNDYPLYAGNWDGNSYVVNYRQLGDKWYFSQAIREGIYGGGGTYNNEIIVTEINTEKSAPLPYLDRLQRGDAFTRMTGEYDEDFWKAYNVSPLSEGLAESVGQLATIRKAQEAFSTENMARLQHKRDSIQKIETLKAQVEMEERGEERFEYNYGRTIPQKKKNTKYPKAQFGIGVGTHLLSTEPGQLGIQFLSDNPESPETILAVEKDLKPRDFEVVANWNLDLHLRKNYFIRFGSSFDFTSSIYKERSLGIGGRFNLSRQRPFFFKTVAEYSNLRYARKVDQAQNDFGKFKADGKKFKAERINLYYGNRTHNLKLSAEFGLELNRSEQLYIRGTYFLPFDRRQDIWLWERKELFRKKNNVPIDDGQVRVTQNGLPFNDRIAPEQSIVITIGMLFF